METMHRRGKEAREREEKTKTRKRLEFKNDEQPTYIYAGIGRKCIFRE